MPGMLWNAGTQCFAPSGGGGLINPAQPVTFAHPWARGLVGFWKVVNNPGFGGGNQFYDLARGGGQSGPNDGALTNMSGAAAATNGFRPNAPPGGWGSVLFDGVAGNVVLPKLTMPAVGSMAIWFLLNATAVSNDQIFGIRTNSPSTLLFDFGSYDGARWYFGWYNSADARITYPTFAVGVWYRILFTWTAAASALYVNALGVASGVSSPIWNTSTQTPYLGFNSYPGQSHYTPMRVDGFTYWSRALSPAEIAADYALAQQGFPGALNYLGTTEYSFPAKAAAGGLLMRRRRSIP